MNDSHLAYDDDWSLGPGSYWTAYTDNDNYVTVLTFNSTEVYVGFSHHYGDDHRGLSLRCLSTVLE